MTKRISYFFILICLILPYMIGCGGAGSVSGGTTLGSSQLSNATLSIHWAARTRSVNGPSSALSVTVSLMDPGLTNTVGTIFADRLAAPAAYTANYPTTERVAPGSYVLFAVFHASTGGTGNVVGTAVASVAVSTTGAITSPSGKALNVGAFSNLNSISILPFQRVSIGAPTSIQVQAQDLQGNIFVLSPGSELLYITSGASFVKKLATGELEGISAGIATVQAKVDGILSQPQTVTVSALEVTPRKVNLASNDLLINPKTGLLYATVPSSGGLSYGNRLVEINPATGRVTRSLFVGSEPDKMAIASDGSVLYIALDGSSSIKEVSTATMSTLKSFAIYQTTGSSSVSVADLKVKPGDPNTIAITYRNGYYSNGPTIYSNGVPLPKSVSYSQGQVMVWPFAQFLYSYDAANSFALSKLFVDSTGVASISSQQGRFSGYKTIIKYASGIIYGSDGSLVSVSTGDLMGHLATSGIDIAPDATLHRAFIASTSNSYGDTNLYFNLYNTSSFLPIRSFVVPGIVDPSSAAPSNLGLNRWGAKGLAFRTAARIYLIDTAPGL